MPLIGCSVRNFSITSGLSAVIERNFTSGNSDVSLFRCGMALTQGAHHVPQNSNTTGDPSRLAHVGASPETTVFRLNGGAGCPMEGLRLSDAASRSGSRIPAM